ncbi:MAG: hypothetical protein R6U62_05620 [Bacteroidales bacterium]
MKAKWTYTFFLAAAMLLILPASSFAQGEENDSKFAESNGQALLSPRFMLGTGTSFSTGGSAFTMFSNWVTPRLSWDMGNQFQLEVGTILSTTRMNGTASLFTTGSQRQESGMVAFGDGTRVSRGTFYAIGSYQVNPRLSITGGTWVERSGFDMADNRLQGYNYQQNPKGMMLGFDYKVTENFRFGAEINVSGGQNPFSPRGFGHSPFPGGMYNRTPFPGLGAW